MAHLRGLFMVPAVRCNLLVWTQLLLPRWTCQPYVSKLAAFSDPFTQYVLGSFYAVRSLLHYSPPPTTNQILSVAYIDNTGVIKAISGPIKASVHQTHTPDTDLFREARKVLNNSNIKITATHVKSHQDEDSGTPFEPLSLSAKLNIQSDQLTTATYAAHSSSAPTPLLPSTTAALYIHNRQVTSKLKEVLMLAYYTQQMRSRYHKKFGWTQGIFDSINWQSSHAVYKRLLYSRKLASFKLQQGLWPTTAVLHLWKEAASPNCLRCLLEPETHAHVLCCNSAQEIRQTLWKKVSSLLHDNLKTPKALTNALEYGIWSWQEGEDAVLWPFPDPAPSDQIDMTLYSAFYQQSWIGWQHAISGLLSKEWGTAMGLYMRSRFPARRFSTSAWMQKTSHKRSTRILSSSMGRQKSFCSWRHPLRTTDLTPPQSYYTSDLSVSTLPLTPYLRMTSLICLVSPVSHSA